MDRILKSKIIENKKLQLFLYDFGNIDICLQNEIIISIQDSFGFGKSFCTELGILLFDSLVILIERFYSDGKFAYSEILESEIPQRLFDYMNNGGQVDIFRKRFFKYKAKLKTR